MKQKSVIDLLAILSILIITVLFCIDLKSIPFHPDETTQIFMSSDLERFLESPLSIVFDPQKTDIRQHYRLIDAPLSRWIIGFARMVIASPALKADWDWSKSWDENRASGALPSDDLLIISRLAIALSIFPSLIFFYFAIKSLVSTRLLSFVGLLLLVINPLILLHARRAMSEGWLLFAVCFNIWIISRQNRSPLFQIAGSGLAILAKQTAISFLFVYLWNHIRHYISGHKSLITTARNIVILGVGLCFFLYIFNPVFWQEFAQAIRASINERAETNNSQTQACNQANPSYVLDDKGERFTSIIANLYFLPPSIADVPNYEVVNKEQSKIYFGSRLHRYEKPFLVGSIFLFITIFGVILAILEQARSPETYRNTTDLLIGTLIQFTALLVFIRFPFQRYVLPLIPFSIIWILIALDRIIQVMISHLRLHRTDI